jgi:hypothetical protein
MRTNGENLTKNLLARIMTDNSCKTAEQNKAKLERDYEFSLYATQHHISPVDDLLVLPDNLLCIFSSSRTYNPIRLPAPKSAPMFCEASENEGKIGNRWYGRRCFRAESCDLFSQGWFWTTLITEIS